MNSRTKKVTALLTIAILLLLLSAWRLKRDYPEELGAIGLDPAVGRSILETDSRTGLQSRGVLKNVVQFSEDMEPRILEDSRWQKSPMDERASYLKQQIPELRQFFPDKDSGYYILLDLAGGQEAPEESPERLCFVLAYYDIGSFRLYYSEVNL